MEKIINLEETPFVDMRVNSKDCHFVSESANKRENLPSDEDSIQYQIYTNFTKFNQKPFTIPDEQHRKIIAQIIKELRAELRINLGENNSKKFKEMASKNADIVLKCLKEGFPQAALIALKNQMHDKRFEVSIEQLIDICNKTKYPLLLTEVQGFLYFEYEEKQTKIPFLKYAKQYLENALSTGLPEAFVWKGFIMNHEGKGIKAYEMYKNAQKLGYEPIAYKYLGFLFQGLISTPDIKKNLRLCEKYLNKAKEEGAFLGKSIQVYYKEIQCQKKLDKERTDVIKSTMNTRSIQLASFVSNKMQQLQKQDWYMVGTKSNWANQESYSLFNEPKTFYVVFSPAMRFPGRHFLVKDVDGNLEYVSIYNWDQIPIKKLQLLHNLGTKIVLNQYIRKLGSGDQLPIYRVDNPNSVEFYPRTQIHRISDSEFRNFAKNLFERGLLDQAIKIYEYMVMKGSDELQVVHSNMGLIKQKQNKVNEAIKFYQKSLAIKTYEKSQVRLARILIDKKQFGRAENYMKEIQTKNERDILQKYISQAKQNEIDEKNFSKAIKNKRMFTKQIFKTDEIIPSQVGNPSSMFNIREDRQTLVYHRRSFESLLNTKNLTENEYLSYLQSIYDNIEGKNLKAQDVQLFLKMAFVCYTIRFQLKLYPHSSSYLEVVAPEAISIHHNPNVNPASITVFSMALRQNYLENRIEDIALPFQEKGNYAEAEKIYRLSAFWVAPFNVKVAQLMFLQFKFQECSQYCEKAIKTMSQFPVQRYFKYIVQLATYDLKCLIKQGKHQIVVSKGQAYIKDWKTKNSRLEFEDSNGKHAVMERMFMSFSKQEVPNTLKNGQHLLRSIYREMVRALINLKSLAKAKEYLKLIQLKKQNSNYHELIESYYHGRLLQILIRKDENPAEAIKLIDSIRKEISQDKKLDNKESYTKFLLKLKLSLFISTSNVQEAIKQSEEIVKINAINLIFVKEQIFGFISKKQQKIREILTRIQQSEILKCLLTDLFEKAKSVLENKIKNQNADEAARDILDSIKKFDVKIEKEDFMEEQEEQQKLAENIKCDFQFYPEQSQEQNRVQDFEDEENIEKYEDQIHRIRGKNGIEYIVLFDKNMKSGLQISQYRKFVCAADHFCLREQGSTGIKIYGDEIRLKIRSSTRLTGKMVPNKNDKKTMFLHFTKRENHDDYKRVKK